MKSISENAESCTSMKTTTQRGKELHEHEVHHTELAEELPEDEVHPSMPKNCKSTKSNTEHAQESTAQNAKELHQQVKH